MAPRRCGPAPGRQVKSGSSESARFTLPEEPRNLNRPTASTTSSGRSPGSTRSRKVRRGSSPLTPTGASSSSPLSRTPPGAPACPPPPRRPGGPGPDLGAGLAGGGGDRLADGAGAALLKSPGPERAVDLSHVVDRKSVV